MIIINDNELDLDEEEVVKAALENMELLDEENWWEEKDYACNILKYF